MTVTALDRPELVNNLDSAARTKFYSDLEPLDSSYTKKARVLRRFPIQTKPKINMTLCIGDTLLHQVTPMFLAPWMSTKPGRPVILMLCNLWYIAL